MTSEQTSGLLLFGGFLLAAVLCHALISTFARAVRISVGISLAWCIAWAIYGAPPGYRWRALFDDPFWALGIAFAVLWPLLISFGVGIPFAWWRARRLRQSGSSGTA